MRYLQSMLLIVAIVVTTSAQNSWKFTHITTDEGLSTGTVNCVLKDSKGYIWIGTIDGLNRYDGYTLEVFKNDKDDPNSIAGNIITTIEEDANGNIWIGTRNNGVIIYSWESGAFSRPIDTSSEVLNTCSVNKILRANDTQVLIGMQNGLCVYNLEDQRSTTYRANPKNPRSLTQDAISTIIRGQNNSFWIGNHYGGVDLFNIQERSFRRYVYDAAIEPIPIRQCLMLDKNQQLWIGTDGKGVIKFNPETKATSVYQQGTSDLNSNIIKSIYQSTNGLMYIGTDGGGINILDPNEGTFTYLKSSLYDDESLSSDAVYEIYEDYSGLIWVSTFRGGVNVYSKFRSKFQLYEQISGEDNSLAFNSVIALEESRDGKIWIGTDGGGLDQLDPVTGRFKHFKSYADPATLSSNVAISLLEDSYGYLWVGTYAGGLNRYDPRTNSFKRYLPDPNDPSSIRSRNVWSIIEDQNNVLWFGLLDGGLARFDRATERFEHFSATGAKGALSSNLVLKILEDSKGNIWVGTEDQGLNQFNKSTKTFKTYKVDPSSSASSLLSNNVRSLYEDKNGILWVGTTAGLNKINLKTMEITASPANQLLPNPVINGILEDKDNNLWISTNQGISKYNPQDQSIQNFSKSDGLQGNEFNYTASLKTSDGKMYFGGIHGLNAFSPQEVVLSSLKPSIVISTIKLFGKDIYQLEDVAFSKATLPYLDAITLRYDQNVLEISFASLDYTSPQSNKYRYRLTGFEEDWVYRDASSRSANYTNLDPGDYTFEVQGTNSDGVWSEETRRLSIEVLPPWWATWWFRLMAAILIMAVSYYIYRWRTEETKRQKRELEQRVEEATSQVVAQNQALQEQQESLQGAIEDTNFVIREAVESGNFSARIDTENKTGEWKALGDSINKLFDSILAPFNSINTLANSMAESDLSNRIQDETKGDVRRITDNLNHALDNLSELLQQIIQQAERINDASNDMMVSSEEMSVSTGEISSSIAEMSRGAQNQVQRIDDASNILESILQFSNDVGGQAESINSAAEKGVQLSDSGKGYISRMDESMKKMLTISEETNRSIVILSEKSSEISRVLNIIKDISVQTNMLALNAAIEAAKAGDSGRGFSVVAEQIRKLAEDSGHSTTEIELMVQEVQDSIESTTQLIAEMSGDINDGVQASQDASQSFEELANSYTQTLDLSTQIVGATKKQNESVRQVVELMESVVVIAEETAAGTEEIASSANELSTGMTEYSEKTKSVSEVINELRGKVNQFKVDSNETSGSEKPNMDVTDKMMDDSADESVATDEEGNHSPIDGVDDDIDAADLLQ